MPGIKGALYFGGTEILEPIDRNNLGPDSVDPDDRSDDGYDIEDNTYPAYENPQTGERTLKRARSPSVDEGLSSKRVRGGKAAIQKAVVANYDSDDGRIISLKQQGYTDEYVCQKMVQEGRVRYVAKTVSSRWLRLRKALQKVEDDKMDDELSDWHEGEDDKLKKSVEVMENDFAVELQRLVERKWRGISEHLANTLHRKKYTAKACRERWEAVQDGTALPPIEIDSDQEGRRIMREARISEAKLVRAEQIAETQRVEEEKKQRADQKKLENAERDRVRMLNQQEKDALKADEERIKLERRDNAEKLRLARKAAIEQAKLQAEWQKKARDTEAALYKKLTGTRMPGAPKGSGRRAKAARRRSGRRYHDDDSDEDGDDKDAEETSDEDEAGMGDDESEEDADNDSASCARETSSGRGNISGLSSSIRAAKTSTMTMTTPVTEETLLNPRSVMTIGELETLLFNRNLPRRGGHETHPQLVARLAAEDAELATPELDELLRKFWDKGKGSKVAKIKRLQMHEANASAVGQDGVKATDLEFKKGYEGYEEEFSGLLGDDGEEMMD